MNQNFIFGIRPVLEAIKSGKIIDKVLIQNGLLNPSIKIIKNKFISQNIKFNYVPIQKLNKITKSNHQGIIIFLSSSKLFSIKTILPTLLEKKIQPFFLVLDRIIDVRNFGALIRTAECVGINAIIIGSISNAPINHHVMKSSAGALNWIPICKEINLIDAVDYIKQMGVYIVAATDKSDKLIFNVQFKKPIAIVLGNEKNGISNNLLKRVNSRVKIPLYGKIQSLNVSVACGVILYEIIRQNLN